MNTEFFFIGLIGFAAITLFGATFIARRAQIVTRPCRATIRYLRRPRNDLRPGAGPETG